jgi:hypothetical protein
MTATPPSNIVISFSGNGETKFRKTLPQPKVLPTAAQIELSKAAPQTVSNDH